VHRRRSRQSRAAMQGASACTGTAHKWHGVRRSCDAASGRSSSGSSDHGPRASTVSFSSDVQIVETVPWNPLGLTDEQVTEGKYVTRAFRRQHPGLPKFSFFDDELLAAAAELAANEARRQAVTERANEDSEASIEIGKCSTGRSRGLCGTYTPGNLITVLATSAAVASAASALAWNDNATSVLTTSSSTAETSAVPSATTESNESVRKAPKLSSLTAAFRWMECKPALCRQNSSTLPMSMRLQRFDSVEQAHARLKPSQHQRRLVGAPQVM